MCLLAVFTKASNSKLNIRKGIHFGIGLDYKLKYFFLYLMFNLVQKVKV